MNADLKIDDEMAEEAHRILQRSDSLVSQGFVVGNDAVTRSGQPCEIADICAYKWSLLGALKRAHVDHTLEMALQDVVFVWSETNDRGVVTFQARRIFVLVTSLCARPFADAQDIIYDFVCKDPRYRISANQELLERIAQSKDEAQRCIKSAIIRLGLLPRVPLP